MRFRGISLALEQKLCGREALIKVDGRKHARRGNILVGRVLGILRRVVKR